MSEPTNIHRQTGNSTAAVDSESAPGENPSSHVQTHEGIVVECSNGDRIEFIGYEESYGATLKSKTHYAATCWSGALQVSTLTTYQGDRSTPEKTRREAVKTFAPGYWLTVAGEHCEWITDTVASF